MALDINIHAVSPVLIGDGTASSAKMLKLNNSVNKNISNTLLEITFFIKLLSITIKFKTYPHNNSILRI
jgi:hypothetical protein